MHKLKGLVSLILLLLATGCAAGRPVYRTDQSRYKTEAEMKVDIYECERGGGWFLFGPAIIVAPLMIVGSIAENVALKNCIEAKGYRFGDLPPQPIKDK